MWKTNYLTLANPKKKTVCLFQARRLLQQNIYAADRGREMRKLHRTEMRYPNCVCVFLCIFEEWIEKLASFMQCIDSVFGVDEITNE